MYIGSLLKSVTSNVTKFSSSTVPDTFVATVSVMSLVSKNLGVLMATLTKKMMVKYLRTRMLVLEG